MATSRLIVIVGETASGKSALAMELALRFNGEIICADSWTVYKGFNIGVAKLAKEDQKLIPHHLLDIADPKHGFSAAQFKTLAEKAISEITTRRKLPILVGGTGLYIDSILYDYKFLPPGLSEQRQELNKLTLTELQRRVGEAGFNTVGIDTRNKRRLIRLLETSGQRPGRSALRSNTLIIGLKTPKEKLTKLITDRVERMLDEGLESEAKVLADKYGWSVEAMKGIGYREWQPYFDGTQTLEKTKARIVSSTLQLAKKQRTWFKRNKSIHWLQDPAEGVSHVAKWLQTVR